MRITVNPVVEKASLSQNPSHFLKFSLSLFLLSIDYPSYRVNLEPFGLSLSAGPLDKLKAVSMSNGSRP
jgi:hypothetical protein